MSRNSSHPGSPPRFPSQAKLWVIAMLITGPIITRAVDPLPAYLRDATEEAQRNYLEREARESRRLQLEVGRSRHDSRLDFKKRVTAFTAGKAAETRAEALDSTVSVGPGLLPSVENFKPSSEWGWSALLATFIVLAFFQRERIMQWLSDRSSDNESETPP